MTHYSEFELPSKLVFGVRLTYSREGRGNDSVIAGRPRGEGHYPAVWMRRTQDGS